MNPVPPLTRQQRIEEACKVLHSESARDSFRKAAELFGDFSVSWSEEDSYNDPFAELFRGGLSIQFYDSSRP